MEQFFSWLKGKNKYTALQKNRKTKGASSSALSGMLKERWWKTSQLSPDQLVLCDEHQSSWHAVASLGEGTCGQSQSPKLAVSRLENHKGWMVWNDEELGENFEGLFESS